MYPWVCRSFLMNLRGLYRYFELDFPPEKFSCYGPLSVVEKLIVTNVAMDSTLELPYPVNIYGPEVLFEDSVKSQFLIVHKCMLFYHTFLCFFFKSEAV